MSNWLGAVGAVGAVGSIGRSAARIGADRVRQTGRGSAIPRGASELVTAARAVATASVVPASAVLAGVDTDAGAKLVVRLHGRAPVVDADQAHIEARVGRPFQVHSCTCENT